MQKRQSESGLVIIEKYDKLRIYLASWIGHATKADSYNLLKLLKWELEYARFKYNTNG